MTFNTVKNIFLIDIGGIGMSALARYFITKKKYVMGYDREYSEITDALQKLGVIITNDEHDYSFIDKLESDLSVLALKEQVLTKMAKLVSLDAMELADSLQINIPSGNEFKDVNDPTDSINLFLN